MTPRTLLMAIWCILLPLTALAVDQTTPPTVDQTSPPAVAPAAPTVNDQTPPPPPPKTLPPTTGVLEYTGKIILVETGGGFYGIESETGEKYIPIDLPELLKQDGMWVRVKAKPTASKNENQTWGSSIRLLKIVVDPCLISEVQVEG